ncbi:regulatory protein [Streptomyces noursei ZPM]|uniref:DUF397 domain-containing protein n=1 Tax=Streptomyces noursei TaxID=1971 RepID=A0A401R618_STRNR|nr:DUF397 domain-containing protein [Streptomyces noursei]AKA05552.1 regulatory protein [Streptomyces noursei ZPM]EOT05145.1 hypothetical protein K530_05093 [Streptomyces noursei CCRC 11814]EXU90252.1 hypothetical protein P354_17685 [Streptomyces noursei PD-1]MCZ0970802.1 DUF397 domain-containing protein [Streptomyces noursei]UWS73950.1 DUF397 domain-containing protein [Streptomyces noursei]
MNHGSTQWVKSSYSSAEGGNCVECAPASAATTGAVPVRDSKTPEGPILTVSTKSFSAFIAAIKNDAF